MLKVNYYYKYISNIEFNSKKVLINNLVGSSFVKQALEGEYPKFLRIFLDLSKRLKERSHNIGIYDIE